MTSVILHRTKLHEYDLVGVPYSFKQLTEMIVLSSYHVK